MTRSYGARPNRNAAAFTVGIMVWVALVADRQANPFSIPKYAQGKKQ